VLVADTDHTVFMYNIDVENLRQIQCQE